MRGWAGVSRGDGELNKESGTGRERSGCIEGGLGDGTDGPGKELNVVRVRRRRVSGLSSRVMRTIHAGGRGEVTLGRRCP